MPHLDVTQTSVALALIGGWISVAGLVTYVIKETLYLSEPLLCLVFGILIGPSALKWLNPHDWTTDLDEVIFQAVRIVIGVQVLFAGIALPKAYLKKNFQSLAVLLLPVMCLAWGTSSLIIWLLFHKLTFIEAMVIASAIAPTDPILANSITKGRFAEKYVPENVRNIIVAESGANDGLGYPFIYISLYLVLWVNPNYTNVNSVGDAFSKWAYDVILYQIALSVVEGLVIGYVARRALKYARQHQYVEHTSFLAYGIGLSFLTLGVVGMVGGDDILACFIAGNSFTWDDYYRLETEDSSFQDVIDTLLNSAIFTFIGALTPWSELTNATYGLTPWRFIVVAILILIFRRLPWVIGLTAITPAFESYRESTFAGFFGPIGVSAIFYLQTALLVLPDDDASHRLRTCIVPIVYFLVFSSVLVHGCTIPLVKGFVPVHSFIRTLSRTSSVKKMTMEDEAAADAALKPVGLEGRHPHHQPHPSFDDNQEDAALPPRGRSAGVGGLPPKAGELVVMFEDELVARETASGTGVRRRSDVGRRVEVVEEADVVG